MGNHYIITDGLNYVCRCQSGKYTISTNESNAIVLDKEKAQNVINNHLPKVNKDKFIPIRVNIKREDDTEDTNINVSTDNYELSENLNEWLDNIVTIKEMAIKAVNKRKFLQDEHSIIEKEIVDLEHYIEFTRFNGCTGYKATIMLQQRLKDRRKIKDELFAINQFLSKIPETNEIIHVEKSIKGLDSRLYEPRVLKELFDV